MGCPLGPNVEPAAKKTSRRHGLPIWAPLRSPYGSYLGPTWKCWRGEDLLYYSLTLLSGSLLAYLAQSPFSKPISTLKVFALGGLFSGPSPLRALTDQRN